MTRRDPGGFLPDHVPDDWEDELPEDLCGAAPKHPVVVAGPPVHCGLVDGHSGRCYSRDLKWFFDGRKS